MPTHGAMVLKEKGRKYVGLPEFARVGGQIVAEIELEQAARHGYERSG